MTIRSRFTFHLLPAFALAMVGVLTMMATAPALAQTFTVLHAFTGGTDGASPNGVTVGGPGILYGTTFFGGTYEWGTVFKLAQRGSGWTVDPLWEFTGGSDGAQPFASVTVGPNGALYGITFLGGTGGCSSGGCGTVYEVQPPATACKTAICYWNETVLHSFQAEASDGQFPEYVSPAFDQAGNMYGTTQDGGTHGGGVLWEVSPSAGGWTESIPHNFQVNYIDGSEPKYGVILDAAGNLYGTTWYGGMLDGGTVYELSQSGGTWTEDTLHGFPLAGGGYSAFPEGLVMDQSGNLYGTVTESGVGHPSVFELTRSDGGWSFSTLYTFSGNTGCYPQSIAIDTAGNLYGSCDEGGAYGYGWVYKLTNSGGSWTVTDLYDFTGQSDGGFPAGAVVLDSSGNLYGGTTIGGNLSDCVEYQSVGCGTSGRSRRKAVVSCQLPGSLSMRGGTMLRTRTAYSRLSGKDSWIAIAALAIAMQLNFAATQSQAQTLNVLYSFPRSGNVGYSPYSGVVMDQAGRLYGTNYYGGEYENGTVYRLARAGSGWIATGLYSFQGEPDGALPMANVVFGPDGTLYGVTELGGTGPAGGYGTVFNLRPPASVCTAALCPWTETVLYRFTGGSDGGFGIYGYLPFASALVLDQAGNIYGTTSIGGVYGDGVVFKLTRSGQSWTESVLWNFTGGTDGSIPLSGVIFDRAGNLYGTATGQAGGGGQVYELSPSGSGWTHKTLYTFTGYDIACPSGGVTMDAQGNLYGTTGGSGSCGDGGEAYVLTPSGGNWTLSRRHTFEAYIGPVETPTLDAQGNLYDTIPSQGLGGGLGEVFKVTPPGSGWIYTDFFEFSSSPGGYPFSGVIFDSSGNLYGTASEGGQYGEGIVWEITP